MKIHYFLRRNLLVSIILISQIITETIEQVDNRRRNGLPNGRSSNENGNSQRALRNGQGRPLIRRKGPVEGQRNYQSEGTIQENRAQVGMNKGYWAGSKDRQTGNFMTRRAQRGGRMRMVRDQVLDENSLSSSGTTITEPTNQMADVCLTNEKTARYCKPALENLAPLANIHV